MQLPQRQLLSEGSHESTPERVDDVRFSHWIETRSDAVWQMHAGNSRLRNHFSLCQPQAVHVTIGGFGGKDRAHQSRQPGGCAAESLGRFAESDADTKQQPLTRRLGVVRSANNDSPRTSRTIRLMGSAGTKAIRISASPIG